MARKQTILILALLTILVPTTSGLGNVRGPKYLLRDGFVLRRVDGRLTTEDSHGNSDKWFFEFSSDVTDGRARIKAGQKLELLPSATLEKMVAGIKKRRESNIIDRESPGATATALEPTSYDVDYRLWARVTKYRGRNFVFPTDFSPLSRQAEPAEAKRSQQEGEKPTINEPNDVLTVPDEIIREGKSKKILPKIARPERPEKALGLEQDSTVADRIGFIRSCARGNAHLAKGENKEEETQNAKRDAQYGFLVFDALGRNIREVRLRLLPCEALERAQGQQSAELDRIRFKIAGIVSKYKGERYLLLQKATRAYSHGNFGR